MAAAMWGAKLKVAMTPDTVGALIGLVAVAHVTDELRLDPLVDRGVQPDGAVSARGLDDHDARMPAAGREAAMTLDLAQLRITAFAVSICLDVLVTHRVQDPGEHLLRPQELVTPTVERAIDDQRLTQPQLRVDLGADVVVARHHPAQIRRRQPQAPTGPQRGAGVHEERE